MVGFTRRPAPARSNARRHQRQSCVWWFLLGAMFGSFGVGLYWMMDAPNQVPPPVAAIPKAERPAPPAPSFEFPSILRDTEVDISEGKPPPPPAPRPEPPPPPAADVPVQAPPVAAQTAQPAPSGSYQLQVGSFRRKEDAERLKAELALLGISTRIESATIKDGQQFHRVRTGPLVGKQALEEARANLARHGKDTMQVKVK